MAVCCQNLPLGVLSSRSALPVPVGVPFKKFGLYLNNPCMMNSKFQNPNWNGFMLIPPQMTAVVLCGLLI